MALGLQWMSPKMRQLAMLHVFAAPCVAVISFLAGLSPPKRGVTIGTSYYTVAVKELAQAKETWDLGGYEFSDEVLEAAQKLGASFMQADPMDEETRLFLQTEALAGATRWGRLQIHVKHYIFWSLQRYLGWSRPDASALFRNYSLFVASQAQFDAFLAKSGASAAAGSGSGLALLDIGSGKGTETQKIAAALRIEPHQAMCLETSSSARSVLRAKGFQVADAFEDIEGAGSLKGQSSFSVAALLNVLDRCDEPRALLQSALDSLRAGGILLVGTVLPFSALVHEGRIGSKWGKAAQRRPRSPLQVPRLKAKTLPKFELNAAAFLAAVFPRETGIELVAWTRLPYLSSGDTKRTHYVIDMALMAFRVPAGAQLPVFDASDEEDETPSLETSELSPTDDEEEAPEDTASGLCSAYARADILSWASQTLLEQGVQSWGDVLDAGAGPSSLCWLLGQDFTSLTGVTAARSGTYGYNKLQAAAASSRRAEAVELVFGNWREEQFLKDRQFDVVVADYLLGAVELVWTYGADHMVDRLLDAVKPGGYLVVVGIEPYEEVLEPERIRKDRIVLEVEVLGDTAAALSGSTSYRELPEHWVLHQIHRRPGFRVVASRHFPMALSGNGLQRQLDFAREKADKIADPGVRKAFQKRIRELRQKCADFGTHRTGRIYVDIAQYHRAV